MWNKTKACMYSAISGRTKQQIAWTLLHDSQTNDSYELVKKRIGQTLECHLSASVIPSFAHLSCPDRRNRERKRKMLSLMSFQRVFWQVCVKQSFLSSCRWVSPPIWSLWFQTTLSSCESDPSVPFVKAFGWRSANEVLDGIFRCVVIVCFISNR